MSDLAVRVGERISKYLRGSEVAWAEDVRLARVVVAAIVEELEAREYSTAPADKPLRLYGTGMRMAAWLREQATPDSEVPE